MTIAIDDFTVDDLNDFNIGIDQFVAIMEYRLKMIKTAQERLNAASDGLILGNTAFHVSHEATAIKDRAESFSRDIGKMMDVFYKVPGGGDE